MKKTTFAFLFFPFIVHANPKAPPLDPEKFTICSIGLNGDDNYSGEQKVIKQQIANDSKNLNPLVEFNLQQKAFAPVDPEWMQKVCDSGIKCDQIIVFGKQRKDWHSDGKDFPLNSIEEKSCKQNCKNIFQDPYEIVLLGDEFQKAPKDYQDPKAQMADLMKKGLSEEDARLVSVAHYTSSHTWNAQRMTRAFGAENQSKDKPVLTINPYVVPREYEDRIKTISSYADTIGENLKKLRDAKTANQVTALNEEIKNYSVNSDSRNCEIKEEHYCVPAVDPKYKEKLLKAYREGDANLKASLAGPLGKHFPNDKAVNSAMEDTILNETSFNAKKAAMLGYNLTTKSNPKILDAYFDGLIGTDSELSKTAEEKLSAVMNPDFQKMVFSKIRGSTDEQRVKLLNVFGRHDKISRGMEDISIKALQDPDPQIRLSSATILGYYRGKDPKIMEKILPLFNDTDERVRGAAVMGISSCDLLPDLIAIVERATTDPSEYVSIRAKHALKEIKYRHALFGGGGIGIPEP